MPTYNFINEQGEIEEHIVKISELDNFKKDNPHLKQALSTPKQIGGISTDSGRLPEGFKDRLREMKAKHPGANGISHLI